LESIRLANMRAEDYIHGLKMSKRNLEKVVQTRRAELIKKLEKARQGDFAYEGCRKIFK